MQNNCGVSLSEQCRSSSIVWLIRLHQCITSLVPSGESLGTRLCTIRSQHTAHMYCICSYLLFVSNPWAQVVKWDSFGHEHLAENIVPWRDTTEWSHLSCLGSYSTWLSDLSCLQTHSLVCRAQSLLTKLQRSLGLLLCSVSISTQLPALVQ